MEDAILYCDLKGTQDSAKIENTDDFIWNTDFYKGYSNDDIGKIKKKIISVSVGGEDMFLFPNMQQRSQMISNLLIELITRDLDDKDELVSNRVHSSLNNIGKKYSICVPKILQSSLSLLETKTLKE